MEELYKMVRPLVLRKQESEEAYSYYFEVFGGQLSWHAEAADMARASLDAAARASKQRDWQPH